ncbi:UNVERIFIED_CONTAM: hypothetical protein NCL1_18140 [Trichonephila clavipes]
MAQCVPKYVFQIMEPIPFDMNNIQKAPKTYRTIVIWFNCKMQQESYSTRKLILRSFRILLFTKSSIRQGLMPEDQWSASRDCNTGISRLDYGASETGHTIVWPYYCGRDRFRGS